MLALLWDDDDDPNVALAAADPKPKVVVGKRRGAVSDSEQGDKGTIKAA